MIGYDLQSHALLRYNAGEWQRLIEQEDFAAALDVQDADELALERSAVQPEACYCERGLSRLVCRPRLWCLQLRHANKGCVDVLLTNVGAWAGTVCGLRLKHADR